MNRKYNFADENADVHDEVYKTSTDELYQSIKRLAMTIYFIFSVFLFTIGIKSLSLIFFVFFIVNIALLLIKGVTMQLTVIIEHIAIFIVAIALVPYLGLQSGFQNILFLTFSMGFFSPFKSRCVISALHATSILIYVLLCFQYFSTPPVYSLSTELLQLINCSVFITISFIITYSFKITDVANLIKNKQLYSQNDFLTNLVKHDVLTDLLNRRAMQDLLKDSWESFHISEKPFHIIMCDIDNFKNINDTFGHDAGDSALKKIALCLKSGFRKHDYISRWGGDEFLILISEFESNANIKELVERVCRKIASESFIPEHPEIKISVTFGVACSSERSSLKDVISLADARLFDGKSKGRNIVIISNAANK